MIKQYILLKLSESSSKHIQTCHLQHHSQAYQSSVYMKCIRYKETTYHYKYEEKGICFKICFLNIFGMNTVYYNLKLI